MNEFLEKVLDHDDDSDLEPIVDGLNMFDDDPDLNDIDVLPDSDEAIEAEVISLNNNVLISAQRVDRIFDSDSETVDDTLSNISCEDEAFQGHSDYSEFSDDDSTEDFDDDDGNDEDENLPSDEEISNNASDVDSIDSSSHMRLREIFESWNEADRLHSIKISAMQDNCFNLLKEQNDITLKRLQDSLDDFNQFLNLWKEKRRRLNDE